MVSGKRLLKKTTKERQLNNLDIENIVGAALAAKYAAKAAPTRMKLHKLFNFHA